MRYRRERQVFLGRGGGKSNCGANVIGAEARKIRENLFHGITFRKAGEHGPERHPRSLKHRLTTTDTRITDNPLNIIPWMISGRAHWQNLLEAIRMISLLLSSAFSFLHALGSHVGPPRLISQLLLARTDSRDTNSGARRSNASSTRRRVRYSP